MGLPGGHAHRCLQASQTLSDGAARSWLAGFLTLPAGAAGITAGTALWWDGMPGLDGPGIILENVVPHLAVVALALALGLWGLGRRWFGGVISLLAVAGLVQVGVLHLRNSHPGLPDPAPDLNVLWFNLFVDNPTPPEALIAALIDSEADIVLLAEARALQPHLTRLEEAFPYQVGCRARRCQMLVLAREAPLDIRMRRIGQQVPERLAWLRVQVPGAGPVTVFGTHMVKPWYAVYSDIDEWIVAHELAAAGTPLLLMGDLNATPWSRRVRGLMHHCGLHYARRQPATWPAMAGGLGVPIDLVLAGGGVALRSVTLWGEGLGSNHRGVMAQLSVTGTEPGCPTPGE